MLSLHVLIHNSLTADASPGQKRIRSASDFIRRLPRRGDVIPKERMGDTRQFQARIASPLCRLTQYMLCSQSLQSIVGLPGVTKPRDLRLTCLRIPVDQLLICRVHRFPLCPPCIYEDGGEIVVSVLAIPAHHRRWMARLNTNCCSKVVPTGADTGWTCGQSNRT